ncbi:hypothetical protein SAMD00023353_5000650 [Rosellinia necatrix]|uniref:Uncharacterized protein n=1 Tax=Rosellinia necatrix TaxID=77044 RepID=A0A1S8A9Q9_ROSNE|nr:hypothetical protein SAMD00023353_5000650 [Rosellinia necatrix]
MLPGTSSIGSFLAGRQAPAISIVAHLSLRSILDGLARHYVHPYILTTSPGY